MKSIAETGLLTLNWIQYGFINRKYALLSGEHQVASLYWNKEKFPRAIGEASSCKWAFQSNRVLYPRVSIKIIASDRLEATFEAAMKGQGTLIYTDGRKFHWLSTDFWNNEWVFTDPKGERLLQFIPEQGLFKIGAKVKLEPQALAYSELPLLVITGWYLLVNINEQDSDLSSLATAVKVK
jgi:hypothetical protein